MQLGGLEKGDSQIDNNLTRLKNLYALCFACGFSSFALPPLTAVADVGREVCTAAQAKGGKQLRGWVIHVGPTSDAELFSFDSKKRKFFSSEEPRDAAAEDEMDYCSEPQSLYLAVMKVVRHQNHSVRLGVLTGLRDVVRYLHALT